jgi:hypothetical protein
MDFHVRLWSAMSENEDRRSWEEILRDTVAEGLRIQHRFRPEPLYKTTGKGSYRSETVQEIAAAKREAKKGSTQNSGELRLNGGMLSYRLLNHEWSIAVSSIRLVGEYTTSNGPWDDDYFLVFMVSAEQPWHQASFYADGRDGVLYRLGEAIGASLELGLCNSADFKSRVIWPLEFAGRNFVELMPADSAVGRFRQKWLGADYELRLTEEIKSVLK